MHYSYSQQHLLTKILVKIIVGLTLGIEILAPLIGALLKPILSMMGMNIKTFLSCSYYGISHGLIWQPFTSLFIMPYGIDFNSLISLAFNMLILWHVGNQLLNRISTEAFLGLIFGCAYTINLLTVLIGSFWTQGALLFGLQPLIWSLLMVWMITSPNAQILLFLVIPVKIQHLILGYFGIQLLVAAGQPSSYGVFQLLYTFLCAAIPYFYGIGLLQLPRVFAPMAAIDKALEKIGYSMRKRYESFTTSNNKSFYHKKSKIIDISSGSPTVPDEEMLNILLDKIHSKGKSSLTIYERLKLAWISWKLRRNKKK